MLFDTIIAAGSCVDEAELMKYWTKVTRPSSNRDEMGSTYKKVIGYDPITFFDEGDIRTKLSELTSTHSELKDFLRNEEIDADKVVAKAMNIHKIHSQRDLDLSLKEALWSLCSNADDSVLAAINDIEVETFDEFDTSSADSDEDDDDEDYEDEVFQNHLKDYYDDTDEEED